MPTAARSVEPAPLTQETAFAESEPGQAVAQPSRVRGFLVERGDSGGWDRGFAVLMALCASSLFGIAVLILGVLVVRSGPAWHAFGLRFFIGTDWNPVQGSFGALPFLFGTLATSALALTIAVPLALGVAVFLTEMCPPRLRAPLSFLTELLAAIPSVVYGLWAIAVLIPLVRDWLGPPLETGLGWTGLFRGPNFGVGLLTAGLVLAIMVLPVISSIARDVMRAVPDAQREAVLALGATRWEMVRMGVLRNARTGIAGAVILGLGRALGETMAVTMVIGNHPAISRSLLAPSYTLASVIANEFTEATNDLYVSALVEIGLALFLLTVVVNAIAQLLVWSTSRQSGARS